MFCQASYLYIMCAKKEFPQETLFLRFHLFTFILILKLTFLIILVDKLVYSLGRIHQSADRLIVIESIYNLGEELAHVSLNKVWLSFDIVTYICEVGCDNTCDIALIVIFIKLSHSVSKKTECGADKYSAASALL